MKKLILSFAALVLAGSMALAQDLASVTEAYNTGANALQMGDKATALASFQDALAGAEALGEEGAEIAANCKNYIPDIQFSIAKELVNNADYDNAVAALKKTIEIATKYANADVAAEAKDLIPQVIMQKANALLKDKDLAGAAAGYKEVLAVDPTNGVAALRLGSALNSAGNFEEAVAAFEQAAANGQEQQAHKQISNIYLKEAASALKAKDFNGAVAHALKVNEYGENAKAYQIAGQASSALKKNSDAIKYFEKYLELSPSAANAAQIAFTVAALYQQGGNKAKALEFYKKALTDPKLGPEAQKMINSLK